MLLSHGAKINAKANNNQTAVALAIQNGIWKIIKIVAVSFSELLSNFVCPGNYDVVEELLKNNADTNIPDENERTLLDIATQQSNYDGILLNICSYIRKMNEQ